MTKRINQKNPADCAMCCLCMFLSISYKEMIDRFPFLVDKVRDVKTGGLNLYEEQLIIWAVTGKATLQMQICFDWDDERRADWLKVIEGKPAIMCVQSLNVEGAFHAVYWDGKKVLDPSNKKRYTKATVKPYNIMF